MRISKKDRAEYNRLKKNVKAKIKRVQQKDNLDLSSLIELPSIENFTRKEFNKWKEQAKKFSSRINKVKYNEHGVPYTNQLVKEYQKRAEKANEIKDKFNKIFADKPFLSGGKPTRLSVLQRDYLMKDADDLGNRTKQKFDVNEYRTLRGMLRKMDRINEEQDINFYSTSMDEMMNNWITALEKRFNSDADFLITKVIMLDPAVFYEIYKSNEDMEFSYIYEEAEDETIQLLMGIIDDYEKGNTASLLKDFPDKW